MNYCLDTTPAIEYSQVQEDFSRFDSIAANKEKVVVTSEADVLLASIGAE